MERHRHGVQLKSMAITGSIALLFFFFSLFFKLRTRFVEEPME